MKNRIRRFAAFFRVLFIVFFVLVPLITGGLWLSGGEIFVEDESSGSVLELLASDIVLDEDLLPAFPLPWETRLLGLCVSMIPMGIAMLSLLWLIRLFSCFTRGEIFTEDTVRYIKRLGWTMLAGVMLTPVYQSLLTLVLTMHNPPGQRMVSISFESADVEELVTAGIIILVSWIMDEGRKLREADELTI